jgi:hypothetical protein
MSRGYDFDDRDAQRDEEPKLPRPAERPPHSQGRGGGSGDNEARSRQRAGRRQDPERFPDSRGGGRREIRMRGRRYDLSARERETLREIGRFRIIDTEALLKHPYSGMAGAMRNEIARLQQQGLLQRRSISVGKNRDTLVIVALTKEGSGIVRQDEQLPENQAVYAGFVKPAEVPHDAAIYQMYQSEAAQIEAKGGKVRRVVLDYELKKEVYSKLAREREAGALEYGRRQQEVADEHGLPVVDGKIALPDLRIEYETPEGDLDHVDLELATEHYHRGQMDVKARAGFKMYGFVSTSRGRRAQWEGRELSATVLSL